MNDHFRLLLELFVTFAKIGGFTIGGGYVMLPVMQRVVVDDKGWLNNDELIDYFALAQSVPGVIAINSTTLIGYRVAKIPGAIAAALGVITPSLVIIMIIAAFFTQFQELIIVQKAFIGIRAAVLAMMIMAIWRLGRLSINNIITSLIAISSFVVLAFNLVSPILVIIAAVLLGLFMVRIDKVAEK